MQKFLLLLFFLSQLCASAYILDTVQNVPREEMPEALRQKFNKKILYMDSAEALSTLDSALKYARKAAHPHLEAMALGLKGIYTSHLYLTKIPGQDSSIIFDLKKAIEISQKGNFLKEEARFNHHLGIALLQLFNNSTEGLTYMLKANNIMSMVGYRNIPGSDGYLYRLASVYSSFRNYEKALTYLKETLKYVEKGSPVHIATLNLSGIIYGKGYMLQQSLQTFREASELVIANADSAKLGMIFGNMATVYLDLGNTDTAKILLKRAYSIDTLYGERISTLSTLFRMSEIHLKEGELKAAEKKIASSFRLINTIPIRDNVAWHEYYSLKRTLLFKMNMLEEAYLYSDSLINIKNELERERDANMLANLGAQLTAEKHFTDIQLLENEKTVQRIIRNTLLSVSGLAIVFLIWLFYSQKKKRQQEQKTFLIKQEKAEEDLKNFRNRIVDKNRLIEQFKKQLQSKPSEDYYENGSTIHKLNESIILTEEDWFEFKKLFENVYPGFLQKMQMEHPSLTIAEIRLLALTKLNLSVSEMAGMLGILPQSVRKTRQRLMKKLDIEHPRELPLFLTGK